MKPFLSRPNSKRLLIVAVAGTVVPIALLFMLMGIFKVAIDARNRHTRLEAEGWYFDGAIRNVDPKVGWAVKPLANERLSVYSNQLRVTDLVTGSGRI